MDQAVGLIFLSGIMLIGSFLAGSIPLIMPMTQDKIHFISIVGAGLLVGTALTVIIPEGIHTLFLSQMQSLQNTPITKTASNVLSPKPILMDILKPSANPEAPKAINHHIESDFKSYFEHAEPFSAVGITLVLGFIFMLLVDQCSRSRSRDIESGHSSKRNFTATLGLVVHSAADGIALGAAATTPHPEVEMIVFFAIMLHKAPAAFGLVSFLLHEGLDKNRVRRHLLIFSLAAPILAIITYFSISQEGKEDQSTMKGTALAMLFSAGTFLYVATVHVLPELTKDSNGFSRKELLGLVIGALTPLLLTSGHKH